MALETAATTDTSATTPPPEDTSSLAEHEASYGSTRPAVEPVHEEPTAAPEVQEKAEPKGEESSEAKAERERDEQGRFTKHRAEKQKAVAEDAPRIRELTYRLRETERQLELLRAQQAGTPASQVGKEAPAGFSEPEPQLTDFEKAEDPYGAWLRAVARWDRRKEAWERSQEYASVQAETTKHHDVQEAMEELRSTEAAYNAKQDEARAKYSDYETLLQQHAQTPIPPLLQVSLLLHENGPDVLYSLMKRPGGLLEAVMLTQGKDPTDDNVALATHWLDSRRALVAQTTGSTAPTTTRKTPPPPPNPVRTVPTRDADAGDDSMSLAEHERRYGLRR